MTPTRTRRRLAVAIALGAMALTVPTSADAASPTRSQVSAGPKWGDCPKDAEAPRGTYCSTIQVPLDYSKPSGRQISLTLSIAGMGNAPHTLVVNPGGPGESGIGLAKLVWSSLPQKLSEMYNVVSFDPRGVGASTPVSCGDTGGLTKHPAPPYAPATRQQEEQRGKVASQIADQCQAKSADLLPHITTENAARDMDRIRAALGRPKLDYLGYSYGTKLGATYATLFPDRTGRMILDSVMDPAATNYDIQFQQNPALQHRAELFFSWVAKHDDTYHMGKSAADVAATWEATRSALAAKPADGKVGRTELDDMLASVMYSDLMWPNLAGAVSDYRRGDLGALLSAADQLSFGDVNAAQLAYNCVDSAWPRNWDTWRKDTEAASAKAPLFAWMNTWYSAPCMYWKTPAVKPVKIGSSTVPPVLLLQAADDAATPVAGARQMHKVLAGSRLVVAAGGNHGQYLFDNNSCMDAYGSRYLLTGEVPAQDATCKAAAPPTP